ncbi:MAG: cytochrome c1 [Pseudomonadota bacterium]
MKKILSVLLLSWLPAMGMAAGGGVALDHLEIDLSDQESMRNGAKVFMTYCLNCHSAKYQRYNRMAEDIGMSLEELKPLMFITDKVGDTMSVAIDHKQAKKWFGTLPPDLSLVARSRGPDWLYTYMRSFYRDDSRPFGVNNLVFKDVGMPHALIDLQGLAEPVYKDETKKEISRLEIKTAGTLTAEQYDDLVSDLVHFLVYVGEPAKLERYSLGVKVILFLVVLTILLYLVKREYWRDVR